MNANLRKSVIALAAIIGIDLPVFEIVRRADAIIDGFPENMPLSNYLAEAVLKEAIKSYVRDQLLAEGNQGS